VFLRLQALLEPFGITRFYTDGRGTYERHVDAAKHVVDKEHMQKIESKHINLRTRIKRLVRRTICFSNETPSSIYPNNSSTAMRHPGTAGSASAISPRRKITGFSGSLAL
jgi:hypothetical protein